MEGVLVSVIVPMYNSESTIRRCVGSILSQSIENLEIILVDDGSKDGTVKIADTLVKTDSRIILSKQNNAGVAIARNAGIKLAKGRYLAFVDSDDVLTKDAIRILVDTAIRFNSELIQGGTAKVYPNGKIQNELECETERVLSREDAMENYIISNKPVVRYAVWGKLFSSTLFKEIQFSDKRNHEDVEIMAKLINAVKNNIVFIPQIVYHNYIFPNSLSRQNYNERKIKDLISTHDTIIHILKNQKEFEKLVHHAGQSKVISLMAVIRDIRSEHSEDWNALQKMVYIEFVKESKQYRFTDLKHILMVMGCRISPCLFSWIIDAVNMVFHK